MNLPEFIQHHGYSFEPTQLDGLHHEFEDSLGNKGWYIGSTLSSGKITFTFGDWRAPGKNFTYISDTNLSEEEKNEFKSVNEKFHAEKLSRQEQTKKNVSDIFSRWERLGSSGTSEYLNRKKLPQTITGTIIKPTQPVGHVLVIPMRDERGDIWNIQSIYDTGEKSFFNFGRVDGLFFELPTISDSEGRAPGDTYIVEGFATGVSLNRATGARVIVSFNLSNLKSVASKFPDAHIVADHDGATAEKIGYNPGLRGAAEAARELNRKMFSVAGLDSKENVDVSDAWVTGRATFVCSSLHELNPEQFLSPPPPTPTPHTSPGTISPTGITSYQDLAVGKWVNGLPPMGIRLGKNGKPILPEEMEVARRLYDYYEGLMVKSGSDLFFWEGRYWRPMDDKDIDNLLRQIMVLHADYGTWSRFKNILNVFQTLIPVAPRNLYFINSSRITFLNGTLALDFKDSTWTMTFREHRKEDFLTNLIPHNYEPEARNELFEETLHNILGDAEFETKRRAVAQMFGSALAPMYPRLFLLVGKPGSGKSTLILLASTLVTDGNISSVQPADFTGFNMEPMAGKLVNAVTDLDISRPITDAVIKQIEDRVPITINRKFKKAIQAPFPAVHIFGANEIPPTLDRGNMSHSRRWTFIPCDHFQREASEHDKERVQRIREAGMQGVINFAIEGLKDLLDAKGHFFVPESGKARMKEWQTENDPIQSFFEAIKNGEVEDLAFDDNERCYTKVVWEKFVAWHDDAYGRRPWVPKQKALKKFEARFGTRAKFYGYYCFRGVVSKNNVVRWTDHVDQGSQESGTRANEKCPGQENTLIDAGRKVVENSSHLY